MVTGATSGIGRAVALQLAREGLSVIVHGRDAARGAATVKEIESAGGHARFIAADLADAAAVTALAEEAGQVEVLVNNGGFSWFGPTAELSWSSERLGETGFLSVALTRARLRQCKSSSATS